MNVIFIFKSYPKPYRHRLIWLEIAIQFLICVDSEDRNIYIYTKTKQKKKTI